MSDSYDPGWDNEELVPLGELRPSREHFGPIGSPEKKAKNQKNKGQGRPQRPEHRQQRDQGQRPQRPQARDGRQPQQQPQQQRQPQHEPQQRERRPRPAGQQQQQPQPQQREQRQPRPQPRDQEIDLRERQPRPQPERRPVPAGRAPQERQPRPQQLQPQPQQRERAPQPRPQRPAPAAQPVVENKPSGLRGVLGRVGGGAQAAPNEVQDAINLPVTDGTLAVFSRKGGVGKTTISAYLGATLASLRGGRILAIDGDAEAGSLGWLLAPKAPATLAALSSVQPTPSTYNDLKAFTASTATGLDIIVGDTDGREVVNQAGLEDALVQVARNYDISIFDTGGGVSVSAGRVLVKHAKVMLLVMGPSVDSIRAAERTLAWVDERPGEAADPNVKIIAVINGIPNTVKESHIERIEQHFAERCAAVVRIPWDEHLAEGTTEVSLDAISKGTRRAFAQLAATTVKVMATQSRRPQLSKTSGGRRAS